MVVGETSGPGVWISRDGGTTWATGPNFSLSGPVAVSANGKRMIAPTATGVQVSNNAGASWTFVDMLPLGSRTVGGNSDLSTVFSGVPAGQQGQIQKSVAVASMTSMTTSGVSGSVAGGAGDALELQYLGNGRWGVLSGVGTAFVLR